MEIIATFFSWVLCILGWIVKYLLVAAVLGGANHALQHCRCLQEDVCTGSDDCKHCWLAMGGYLLWPIVIPAVITYELASSVSLRMASKLLSDVREQRRLREECKELRCLLASANVRVNTLQAQLPGNRDHRGRPIDS